MDDRLLGIIIGSFTKLLIPGLTVTIPLTLISFAIGLVLAIAVALVRVAKVPMVHRIAQFYVWVFRGTPLLVQLFVIFFGLPSVGIVVPAFPSALIAFSLNVGAYASETSRSYSRGAKGAGRSRPDHEPQLSDHYEADRAAPSFPVGVPCIVQYVHLFGERHFTGREHHRGRDVHGRAAYRRHRL